MATSSPNSSLISILECELCLQRLTPPTNTCPSGHNACSTCNKKQTTCPRCTLPFSIQSNTTLDQIIEKTQFPCVYEEIGCRSKLAYRAILKHEEKECQYRQVRCILGRTGQKCNEAVGREAWPQHMLACRNKTFVQSFQLDKDIKRTVTIQQPSMFSQTMFRWGDLYFVETMSFNMEVKTFFLCYHYVGTISHSRKYIYTVNIDREKMPRAWKFSSPCMPFVATEYDIKKDKRSAVVDPTKFHDNLKILHYTFKIETVESFNTRRSKKK